MQKFPDVEKEKQTNKKNKNNPIPPKLAGWEGKEKKKEKEKIK